MTSFSERHGFTTPEAPITVRDGDPGPLRSAVWRFAVKASKSDGELADVIVRSVYFPGFDPRKPNYEQVELALRQCHWDQVYEAAELVYGALGKWREGRASGFQNDLNHFMRQAGIGWQMVDGKFEVRGEASFEATVYGARYVLAASGNVTAERELHEAVADLSRRPEPDITGAMQHAGAALECLARDICGDPKKTYGELVKANPNRLPKPPLGTALEKAWGNVSEKGRHLQEGKPPSFNEAMLVVGLVVLVGFG